MIENSAAANYKLKETKLNVSIYNENSRMRTGEHGFIKTWFCTGKIFCHSTGTCMLAPSRYTSRTEEHIPEYNEQLSVLLIRIFAGESNQR